MELLLKGPSTCTDSTRATQVRETDRATQLLAFLVIPQIHGEHNQMETRPQRHEDPLSLTILISSIEIFPVKLVHWAGERWFGGHSVCCPLSTYIKSDMLMFHLFISTTGGRSQAWGGVRRGGGVMQILGAYWPASQDEC